MARGYLVAYGNPTSSFLYHSAAIRAGAVIGATLEVEGIARRLNVDKVIVTGGDAALIAANADINVAVEPHLVAFGLNRIFEYNEYL